uniref:Uncharacterized protein n=1 Tax=Meloidogyne hapla TaxID=6305 RepID=A0A1I8BHG2_MELHA
MSNNSSNSFDDLSNGGICSSQFKQENCQKLIQILEQNSLLEQLEENKKLINENNLLSKQLILFNSEILKIKEERNLNLEELSKLQKDYQELNNELINSKNIISQLQIKETQKIEKINNEKEVEQSNTSINSKIAELTLKLEELQNEAKNLVRFVFLSNKINIISTKFTCCSLKCINSNLSNGNCINGKGFVCIENEIKLKYKIMEGEGLEEIKK